MDLFREAAGPLQLLLQGVCTRISVETYSHLWFSWGSVDPLLRPLDPPMLIRILVWLEVIWFRNASTHTSGNTFIDCRRVDT